MLLYIIIAIIMFGLLIAIHEFGHFIAAKSLGVKVNEFAIGMGPKLLSRQKGETLYSLRALPIGGFCAMEGEEEASNDPRAFHNKPAWKKFIILVAGAFMNFAAGVLIILLLFSQAAGFTAPVVTGYFDGAQVLEEQGLLTGDRLYRVDGHRIYSNSDALLFLDRAGDTVDLEVLRGGERVLLEDFYFPRQYPSETESGTVYKRGIYIGAAEEATPALILKNTWYQSIDYVRMVWISLGVLFTGAVGIKDMSGAIGIVTILGQAGEQGAAEAVENNTSPLLGAANAILNFVAFIAINLAVMNLLPIPALDGGQILFLVVGGIYHLFTRKRIDQKYLSYINMAGFFCLIALMAVVAVNDVVKLF